MSAAVSPMGEVTDRMFTYAEAYGALSGAVRLHLLGSMNTDLLAKIYAESEEKVRPLMPAFPPR